jgi:hypothetical protein
LAHTRRPAIRRAALFFAREPRARKAYENFSARRRRRACAGVAQATLCRIRISFFDWRPSPSLPQPRGILHSAFGIHHFLLGVFWIRPCAYVHRGMPEVMTSPQPVIKKTNANNEELALAA